MGGGGGGGGGTVIITYAPGPGLCHSQRFFERFFGDSLRDSLEMDLVRSLTITLNYNHNEYEYHFLGNWFGHF